MLVSATPILKDVVLVGAGHAHVGVLRSFGMNPVAGVRLTLITRQVDTPYSGMLPGLIAGHYGFDDVHIDTGPLCRFANARLYNSEAIGIDPDKRLVHCRDRPPVPYDVLSLNIGSTPNNTAVKGAGGTIAVKPIDSFLARFDAALARILERRGRAHVAVVGAGAGGTELMLALQHRIASEVRRAGCDPAGLAFTLVASSAEVLPTFPDKVRRRFTEILGQRGIRVLAGAAVIGAEGNRLEIAGQSPLECDEVFWTTRAAPAPWLGETGLALDGKGFVRIRPTLQSVSHDDVFASGDVAAFERRELPRSGVYAVRAGKPLADNIRRLIAGHRLRDWRPQTDALYLLTTGNRSAIGTRNGVSFEGDWVWRWKDWIDRRFMAKFNRLPLMAMAAAPTVTGVADKDAIKEISALAMRCGGCGAKVGATVLTRALGSITPVERNDVVIGLAAPDDAAVVDTGSEKLSVHSVDYFRAIVDDPYLFGKIAANHSLGDIYAMGAEPQVALAIATVPYGLEAKVEADLSMLMAGANEVLSAAGCALVGGHTSEGAELALGFSVTGLIARERLLRKGGLVAGDALILTKPIGTGTLLAADMRGKAKARWVMAAIQHMIVSNREGARILSDHGAHSATDLTGFGLIGHLVEMIKASDVDARLVLADVPLIEGARETIGMGIVSSLQPQNVRLRRAIRDLSRVATDPLYPALFDPQTAGGLLASVPATRAAGCIAALKAAGYSQAAIIGEVLPRSTALEPISIDIGRQTIQSEPATEPSPTAGPSPEFSAPGSQAKARSHESQPVL